MSQGGIGKTRRRRVGAAIIAASLALALGGGAQAQEADLARLRAASKAAPTDAAASFALGKALRRAGHFPEAGLELQRGGLGQNALTTNLKGPMLLELARTRIDQRDLGGALRACEGLGKTTAISNACRAEAHLLQNRATEAYPFLEQAMKSDPSLYEGKVAMGRALALMGKVAEAEANLRGATAGNDARPEGHRYLGLFLVEKGLRDAGVAELKKAASADPNDPEIALDIGQALGGGREAREQLARATRIRPGFAPALAELARVSLDLGEGAAAESAAVDAIKVDATQVAAHLVLGRIRVGQRRWDEAIKEGEIARKLLPNSAVAELVVADASAGKGDIDAATVAYQSAFSLDRKDPSPLVRGAEASIAAGRFTTARGFADKATLEFPKWAPAWIALGDAAAKQGQTPKARGAYETALKQDGAFDREAVRKKLAALR